MALSATGYQTTGTQPGIVAAQGNYIPVTGANATYNGATQYTNGTYFLAYNTGWSIQSTISSNGVPLYIAGSGSTTNFPLTGWAVSNVAAPAPTFTAIGGAASASAARIQPRVVVF